MGLQFNCNGIDDKIHEITQNKDQNNISVAAFQETKLTDKSKLIVPNYSEERSWHQETDSPSLSKTTVNTVKLKYHQADNHTTIVASCLIWNDR